MIGEEQTHSQVTNFISNVVRSSPVTVLIVAANVAMFVLLLISGGPNDPTNLYRWGAKFGPAIQNGDWYRLILPVILHAGFLHLAANTFALVIFGPRLESEFGRAAFFGVYVVSGVCGVAASYLVSPTLSVGASGAVFGIVGAYGIYLVRNRREFGSAVNPVIMNLLIVLGINIAFGLFWSGIDQGAHVGGLIAGAATGLVLSPRRIVDIEDDFYIFGAPIVRTRIETATVSRTLAVTGVGLAIALAIAWWVSANVEYDAGTMQSYGIFELLTR